MKLFHTSPTEITKINASGRFGEFLFFSTSEYVMTAGKHITYTIDLPDAAVIDAESLFYHADAGKLRDLVESVKALAECDDETAEDLIAQRIDIHSIESDIDPEDLADVSWRIQAITARAASALGYRGVAMNDEQGRAYLINMLGRENELEVSQ